MWANHLMSTWYHTGISSVKLFLLRYRNDSFKGMSISRDSLTRGHSYGPSEPSEGGVSVRHSTGQGEPVQGHTEPSTGLHAPGQLDAPWAGGPDTPHLLTLDVGTPTQGERQREVAGQVEQPRAVMSLKHHLLTTSLSHQLPPVLRPPCIPGSTPP